MNVRKNLHILMLLILGLICAELPTSSLAVEPSTTGEETPESIPYENSVKKETPFVKLTVPGLRRGAITSVTEIIGTVESQILKDWRLEYRRPSDKCADWITFATGTGEVHEGTLGNFDPTLLRNGIYEIRIVANDYANRITTTSPIKVVVEGGMKIGHFTVSFNDLTIKMPGLDLTVARTYDSRDKCSGDFGVGWNLDLNTVRLEKTHPIYKHWSGETSGGGLPVYYIEDTGPHTVTITFPDGKVERFTPFIEIVDRVGFGGTPPNAQAFIPPNEGARLKMLYNPAKGTHGKLTAKGVPEYFYRSDAFLGDMLFVKEVYDFFNLMTEPTGFTYTSQDGRTFNFDANGKTNQHADRVGNTITITNSGVYHSSGKAITWTRDAAGRITTVTDPKGNTLHYTYDILGDLKEFYDRTATYPGEPTATITYHSGHDLNEIRDAKGQRAAKNIYDDDGRLIRSIDAKGKETVFTHNVDGKTETIRDRAGNVTTHKYDERGNVVQTINAKNEITNVTYHTWSDGTKSDLKTSESITGKFTDDNGNLVTKTLTTNYSYEDDDPNTPPTNDGLLRKIVGPMGHTTKMTYDERGKLLTMTDPRTTASNGPPTIINTYYSNGQLRSMQDADGNVTALTYDETGNPDTETKSVTLINADGSTRVATLVTDTDYDSYGFMTKMTDAKGHVITYTPDANGNRILETTTRTVSPGNVVTMVMEHEYDDNDRLTKTWMADNPKATAVRPSSETVYNDIGQAEWIYDALGHGTHQEYDDRGQASKTTYPDSTFEQISYDEDGRPELLTDRRGKRSRTIYDELGRVSQRIFLDGETGPITLTTSKYDAAGRTYQSTDARNLTTTFVYDNAGQRTKTIDALGQVNRFDYDDNGNQTKFFDNKNRLIQNVFNSLNRRTKTIYPSSTVDINGSPVATATEAVAEYDEMGRQTRVYEQSPVSTPLSQRKVTQFGYDELGRLIHVIDPAGQVTKYSFDELGNQLTQTDANLHSTNYSYDNIGRRLTRMLPLGQVEQTQYDLAGNLRYRTDFNGKTTEFQYDSMNRLRFKIPDASLNQDPVEYTYTASGQRDTMTDNTGTTTYHYTARDQLDQKATPFGTLNYSYNAHGAVTGITSGNTNGLQVTYEYDELNRIDKVIDANTGSTSYQYDEVGNLKNVDYPNLVRHHYDYNEVNRLSDLTVTHLPAQTLANYQYTVDPTGKRTSASETIAAPSGGQGLNRKASFAYDTLNRLQRETIASLGTGTPGPTGTIQYTFDAVGNRLTRSSSVSGVGSQIFTYDANDRVNGDTYDNNGNTVVGETRTHPVDAGTPKRATDNYSFEDRLTDRSNPDGSKVKLLYDGDGNLVSESTTTNGITQTVTYLVDTLNPTGYSQVVEEHFNGIVSKVYTYGHDLISVDQIDGSGTFSASFYGYDGHGSVRFLTDEIGQVTDTYTYDAFGELIHRQGSTISAYLYCGERYVDSLGLYHLRARFMSTNYGRFWNVDQFEGTKEDPKSLHKYLYCSGDPVNSIDPSGYSQSGEALTFTTIAATLARFASFGVSRALNFVLFSALRVETATKVVLFLDVFTLAAGSIFLVADILDGMAERLLNNDKQIPPGAFPRGVQIEQTAGANLGGNVEGIDHYERGAAVQVKSYTSNSGEDLAKKIKGELENMKTLGKRTLGGKTDNGKIVSYPPGSIDAKGLLIAIPEDQAAHGLHPAVRSILRSYRQNYNTLVRVVPVRGWFVKGSK